MKKIIIICILIAIGWFAKAVIDYLPMMDDAYWYERHVETSPFKKDAEIIWGYSSKSSGLSWAHEASLFLEKDNKTSSSNNKHIFLDGKIDSLQNLKFCYYTDPTDKCSEILTDFKEDELEKVIFREAEHLNLEFVRDDKFHYRVNLPNPGGLDCYSIDSYFDEIKLKGE